MEPENKEVVEEKQEVQYSEAEQKAMSDGWVPKDQWQGDPDDWVPAKQFLRNGELFGRINSYKHKIQNLEKSVTTLVKHNEKVFEAGYKAAEDALKAQRRDALREGDAEAVEQIEEKLEELREEHAEQKQEFQAAQSAGPAMHPAWEPWVEQNKWYATDAAMRGFADGVAREIVDTAKAEGVTIEFDKLLVEVGRKVKQRFSDKFGNQTRQTTVKDDAPAGAGGKPKASKADDIEAQMSPMEIQIMNTVLSTGVSKEKYLKDYKAIQGKGR